VFRRIPVPSEVGRTQNDRAGTKGKRVTGTTAERIARRANQKQDQCLHGERFNEPASMEESSPRLEDAQ
jgi:hypothetical protein